MIQKFFQNFKNLPLSNKSMVYLMWIYGMGGVIGGLFVNIYIFQLNKEIIDVIYYNIVFFTFTFLGFSLVGHIVSLFGKDIKNMYYFSYLLFIFSFFFLLGFHDHMTVILFFASIYGLGNGAFRCAVHTQELVHIADEKRDLYSSSIIAGGTVIGISMPLVVAGVFYLSKILQYNGYMILFLFLPILYMSSFLFIKNIESYIPKKIKKADVSNFFNIKKYKFGLLYIIGVSLYQGIGFITGATVSIYLLKTEINVGVFEGIISLLSTLLLVHIAHKRTPHNRIQIMGYLSVLLALNYFIFVGFFNIYGYFIFTFLGIIIGPLFRVSEHVYDLQIMDSIKVKGSDFFPAMILREVLLWIGRMIVMGIILYIALVFDGDIQNVLRIAISLIPVFLFLSWCSIYLHVKLEASVPNSQ